MKKIYLLLCFCLLGSSLLEAQTMLPLPPHDNVYTGSVRGYWFVAPTSFTITGLRVPPEAGSGLQYIHVMKCHAPFPVPTSGSTDFTTLTYISGAANGVIQSVNIPVNQGDTIGILGTAGVANSYTASTTHSSTLAGFTISLTRFGYQGDIDMGPAPEYWGSAMGASGAISRIEMYYTTGPCTDPPTAGTTVASTTSVCPGGTVTLSLSGNSSGTGQTYVWESSVGGPFTPISTSSPSGNYTVSPTVTTSYRAAVTCGTSTTYSTPVTVAVSTGASGLYTVDATAAPGPGIYPSLSAALAAVGCGVSGPVTIDIVANSGPYNEQVVIPAISGTSASMPITINGNGNTISFAPTSSAKYVMMLDGADYVTINNLNITSTSTTYGYGILFTNGADNNTISNCTIDLNQITSTTSSNSAGIVGSASVTSGVSAGNNGSNNKFIGNTIMGGYRSVSYVGSAGTGAMNNVFENNTIQDFYADGIYVEDNDGLMIAGNNIMRPTRTNEGTGAAIEIGPGCRSVMIRENEIHDTHTNATSGTFYGIYFNDCDAPVGFENRVINNLLYKFNSSSGTIYAFYNDDSDGTWFHHNTVVLDHQSATSGTTRGFYQNTTATNIQFTNNNIYITRSGTGTKYCIYIGDPSTIISNNNNLYLNAAAGSNYYGYYSGSHTTFANWQAANGGAYDQQSVSMDPMFLNAMAGDYTPTNVLMDNLGSLAGVSIDINGNPRSGTLPDIGSYEFLTVPTPLSVQLLAFSANRKAGQVWLSWQVSEEKNLTEYIVERSADGIGFSEIGTVSATGRSSYEMEDRNAASLAGRLYYRLKMLDESGRFSYSKVATVDLNAAPSVFSVHPNPFSDRVSLTVSADASGLCRLRIVDIRGRTVTSQSVPVTSGQNSITIEGLERLPSGTYRIVADINGLTGTATMVK